MSADITCGKAQMVMQRRGYERPLLGVWRPEPEPRAEAEQAAGSEASAAAPRKPARPRKARKGTAGPGSAQDASQGQPGTADEAIIDPDKQAGGLPVDSDG